MFIFQLILSTVLIIQKHIDMKHKVGDVVRVIHNYHEHNIPIGDVVTIIEEDDYCYLTNTGWYVEDDEIESVDENTYRSEVIEAATDPELLNIISDGYFAGKDDWTSVEQEEATKAGWRLGFKYAVFQLNK